MFKKLCATLTVLTLASTGIAPTSALAEDTKIQSHSKDAKLSNSDNIPNSVVIDAQSDKNTHTYSLSPGDLTNILSTLNGSISANETLTLILGNGTYYLPREFNKNTVIRGKGNDTVLMRNSNGGNTFSTVNTSPLTLNDVSIKLGDNPRTVFIAKHNLTLDHVTVSANPRDVGKLRSQRIDDMQRSLREIAANAKEAAVVVQKGKTTITNSSFPNVSGIRTEGVDATAEISKNSFMPPVNGFAIELTWGNKGTLPKRVSQSSISQNTIDTTNNGYGINVKIDNVLVEGNDFILGNRKSEFDPLLTILQNNEKSDGSTQDVIDFVFNIVAKDTNGISVGDYDLNNNETYHPKEITILSNTFAGSGVPVSSTHYSIQDDGTFTYDRLSLENNFAKNGFANSDLLVNTFNADRNVSFDRQEELSAPAFHAANQRNKKTIPDGVTASIYDQATFSVGEVKNGVLNVDVESGVYSDDGKTAEKGGSLQEVLEDIKGSLANYKGIKKVALNLEKGVYVSPTSSLIGDGVSLKIAGAGTDETTLIGASKTVNNLKQIDPFIIESRTEISDLTFSTMGMQGPTIVANADLTVNNVNATTVYEKRSSLTYEKFDWDNINDLIDNLDQVAADMKAEYMGSLVDDITAGGKEYFIVTGGSNVEGFNLEEGLKAPTKDFKVSLDGVMVENQVAIEANSKFANFDITNSTFSTPPLHGALMFNETGGTYKLNDVHIIAKYGSAGIVSAVDNLNATDLNLETSNDHLGWAKKLYEKISEFEETLGHSLNTAHGMESLILNQINQIAKSKSRAITLKMVGKTKRVTPKNISISVAKSQIADDDSAIYATFGKDQDGLKVTPSDTKVEYGWLQETIMPHGQLRFFGATRFETAVDIAKNTFPHGAKTVILARHDNPVDALATAPLAKYLNAPVLLTPSDHLHEATKKAVEELIPAGATVHIVGGEKAVSNSVAQKLTAEGYQIERISGSNRAATAVAIATKINAEKAFVVDGNSWDMALIAGPAAAKDNSAILLNYGDTIAPETAAYIDQHLNEEPLHLPTASNLAEISTKVANQWFKDSPITAVSTAKDFADSLTGGAAAAKVGAPIILVDNKVSTHQSDLLAKSRTTIVFGGEKALSNEALSIK